LFLRFPSLYRKAKIKENKRINLIKNKIKIPAFYLKSLMGIYKLMSLLQEKAPDCIKRLGIEVFSGRTIACDASMVSLISF
jgi:hypothetical protein